MPTNQENKNGINLPKFQHVQCSQCETKVDPLRAVSVSIHLGALHVFCSTACKQAFSKTDQGQQHFRSLSFENTSFLTQNKNSTPTKNARTSTQTFNKPDRISKSDSDSYSFQQFKRYALPFFLSVIAFVLGFQSSALPFIFASTLISIFAIVMATYNHSDAVKDFPHAYWLVPFFGSVLICISSLLIVKNQYSLWASLFPSLICFIVILRNVFDEIILRKTKNILFDHKVRLPQNAEVLTTHGYMVGANTQTRSTASLNTGELFVLQEGMVVPADGVIQDGHIGVSLADQPTLHKKKGDFVLGGMHVAAGQAQVIARRVSQNCWLTNHLPISEVKNAQSRAGKNIETFYRILIPFFVFLNLGLWFFGTQEQTSLLLLYLSTAVTSFPIRSLWMTSRAPLVIADVLSKRRGFLFPNLQTLDKTAAVTKVAIPLRGVLTEGTLEVVSIDPIDQADIPSSLLSHVSSAEKAALPRPIATNMIAFFRRKGIQPAPVRQATFTQGKGTSSWTEDGEHLLVGSRQLLIEHGVSTAKADQRASRLEKQGYLVLFIALNGKVIALVSLQDHILPSARAAIQRFLDLHLEIALLSSNHRNTVQSLVQNLDIQHIKSDLLPGEKNDEIQKLKEDGGIVAAVGFPQEHTQALQAAHISIMFNAPMETKSNHQINMVSQNLIDVASALWIAKRCHQKTWRTLIFSAASAFFLMILSSFGWLSPPLALLSLFAIEAITLPAAMHLAKQIERHLPIQ